MASKFKRGATVYTLKGGRRYTVEEVEGGTIYCTADSGAEADFAEADLLTEAEWAARSEDRSGLVYAIVRRAKPYVLAPVRVDAKAAEAALQKIERLRPGILDFAAFITARTIIAEAGEKEPVNGLSIKSCREIFDAATPPIRANIIGSLLGTPADRLADAARLGDNLMRAMVDKGLESREEEFRQFRRR